ncbi:hypothetical protein XOCgx_3534 [Xanthomonas oryzae pv. oryzicola]|nr:hypothetical protein XOCgx_3534 [Xanthomonas oryzae pv. oryzicola]
MPRSAITLGNPRASRNAPVGSRCQAHYTASNSAGSIVAGTSMPCS